MAARAISSRAVSSMSLAEIARGTAFTRRPADVGRPRGAPLRAERPGGTAWPRRRTADPVRADRQAGGVPEERERHGGLAGGVGDRGERHERGGATQAVEHVVRVLEATRGSGGPPVGVSHTSWLVKKAASAARDLQVLKRQQQVGCRPAAAHLGQDGGQGLELVGRRRSAGPPGPPSMPQAQPADHSVMKALATPSLSSAGVTSSTA